MELNEVDLQCHFNYFCLNISVAYFSGLLRQIAGGLTQDITLPMTLSDI